MTKIKAKKKIQRIIKANTHTYYGGQFDQEKRIHVDIPELEQDLFDFIDLHWREEDNV